jgi:hypothetical protein
MLLHYSDSSSKRGRASPSQHLDQTARLELQPQTARGHVFEPEK